MIEINFLTNRTRHRMGEEIEVKKCGVKFDPPSIMLTYVIKGTGKLHRRRMPLRNFHKNSEIERAADDLKNNPRHSIYLDTLTKAQLERLITIIRDKMNGLSLEASLKRNNKMDTIDPEEDLNKVDDETLHRKKSIMEETFEKHRKKPTDPDFQYDVEVDFEPHVGIESSGWDSDSDPEF